MIELSINNFEIIYYNYLDVITKFINNWNPIPIYLSEKGESNFTDNAMELIEDGGNVCCLTGGESGEDCRNAEQ